MVERYTKSVRFEDSIKFYAATVKKDGDGANKILAWISHVKLGT